MLVVLIVLTPLSVVWKWPDVVSAAFLFAVIGLLLLTGQTIIFLLRLVAADRRGRRRPLGSATRTVGELEDEAADELAAGRRPAERLTAHSAKCVPDVRRRSSHARSSSARPIALVLRRCSTGAALPRRDAVRLRPASPAERPTAAHRHGQTRMADPTTNWCESRRDRPG